MPAERKGMCIKYDVYETPSPDGGTPTYHARRTSDTIDDQDLYNRIAGHHTPIAPGTFRLVVESLKEELIHQLLDGYDVHIKGMGTFYMKIATKHKHIANPDDIGARELQVEGIGFRADKAFQDRVRHANVYFERHERRHSEAVDPAQMEAWLTDYCRQHGYFTINTLMGQFGLTKYKASRIANQMVSGDNPRFTRYKEGSSYHYRLAGV